MRAIDFLNFRPPDMLTPHAGISITTAAAQPSERLRRLPGELSGNCASATSPIPSISRAAREAIVELISGADMMIYDCMYTDAEFDWCRGYGHSTWQQGVRLCEAAGVRRLVIFHHRPGRDDADLRQIEAEAQARFAGAIMAGAGLEIMP